MPEPDELQSLTLAGFLDRLASDEPAPGGGAAAAFAVAAAASLAGMAARFSGHRLDDAEALAARADDLRALAMPLADADGDAYRAVLAAYRAARDNPEAREQVTEALVTASDIPRQIAEAGAAVAVLAERLGRDGNPNLLGDTVTAALLADAGAQAATALVELNVRAGDLDETPLEQARQACSTTAAVRRTLSGDADTDGRAAP